MNTVWCGFARSIAILSVRSLRGSKTWLVLVLDLWVEKRRSWGCAGSQGGPAQTEEEEDEGSRTVAAASGFLNPMRPFLS